MGRCFGVTFSHTLAQRRLDDKSPVASCLPPVQVTHISRIGGNLQIRKEDVRANVFKPTVALPTMSVEEFGEIELERARLQQVRGGFGVSIAACQDLLTHPHLKPQRNILEISWTAMWPMNICSSPSLRLSRPFEPSWPGANVCELQEVLLYNSPLEEHGFEVDWRPLTICVWSKRENNQERGESRCFNTVGGSTPKPPTGTPNMLSYE